MRRRSLAFTGLLLLWAGCGGGGGTSSRPAPVNNVLLVQVTPGPTNSFANGLFTSVTLCEPGTSTCQTIPDVLVDTGSSGLRILASQLSLSLPRFAGSDGAPVGECAQFTSTFDWGPVATADVQVAGEKASALPVQILGESSFPAPPSSCTSSGLTENDTVAKLGANGILGIGLARFDCGDSCTSAHFQPGVYFSCPSSGCSATPVALQNQVQNPVALLAQDNNGVLVSLPAISDSGAATVHGSLIFGIGTQSNNALGSARVFTTDAHGEISTTFQGTVHSGTFLDTGSNGIFFLDSAAVGVPDCPGKASGFYCPAATQTFQVTNQGVNGTSAPLTFKIANANSLFSSGNFAFNDLGGANPGAFDFGLPFFFGRNVFVAIDGQATPAGSGPFWAY